MLYIWDELESSHHEVHSDHKIVRRDIHEIKVDKQKNVPLSNQQASDPLKKLGVEVNINILMQHILRLVF